MKTKQFTHSKKPSQNKYSSHWLGSSLLIMLAYMQGVNAAISPPYLSVGVDIGNVAHDSGPVKQPFVNESNSASSTNPNGSTASANGTASADNFGTLKVAASAAVSPGAHAVISSVANTAETFHFLPAPGASISFLATLEWSGQLTPQCPAGGECVVNVTNQLLDLDQGSYAKMTNNLYYDSSDPNHNTLPSNGQSVQQVWTFTSPATFDLNEQLILSMSVTGTTNSAGFSGDLSHTGHFYLDPITPGATYTTASGNLYLSPSSVPIPAAIWLFGSVFAGFLGLNRKKAQY